MAADEGLSTDDEHAAEHSDRAGSIRELLTVALPLMLSAGSLSIMSFCDRIFLGRHSPEELAGSMPAHVLHWVFLSLPLGTAFYASTFVAQYDGAKRHNRVGKALWQSIYLAAGAGVVFTLLAPFSHWIFEFTDHDPDVIPHEVAYFGTLCYGTIPIILAPVFACFYIGRGRSTVVLWANLVSVGVNLLLGWVLIFGIGPFPELGATGAAIGTVCGRSAALAFYVWLITYSKDARPYAIWANRGFNRELFTRMLRYGVPNGLFWFTDVTAFSVMVFLVGKLGTEELGATNIAFSLNMLAFVPLVGMGHSVSTLVGRRVGEERPRLAIRTTWVAYALSSAYMAMWVAVYLGLPDLAVFPYVPEENPESFEPVRRLTVQLLRFVAVYSMFDAMAVIFSNAVRGAGDTRFSVVFTGLTAWGLMALPVAILHYVYGAGLFPMWWAVTGYIVVVGSGFLWRFQAGHWQRMKVIEDEPADLHDESEPATVAVPARQPEGVSGAAGPVTTDTVAARREP